MASMDMIFAFFIIVQVELLVMITLLIILMMHDFKKRKKKADPLLKHVKEYLVEGYTLRQATDKLAKLGFDKERTEKIATDFLKH